MISPRSEPSATLGCLIAIDVGGGTGSSRERATSSAKKWLELEFDGFVSCPPLRA